MVSFVAHFYIRPSSLYSLLWTLLLITTSTSHAAPAPPLTDSAPPLGDPKYTRFEHITVEDGLSHATVLSVIQDKDGFMWFGTQDGLNRYDGYNITVFRHDEDNPYSLSNNNIFPVYETRDGLIWIGTDPGGLNQYDRRTGKFHAYRHDPSDPDSLSNDSVWAIYEDDQGYLWLGTRDGLNRFDRETGKFTVYKSSAENPRSLSNNLVYRIYQDRQGVLWVGTRDGLNRYDPASDDFTVYRNDPNNPDSLSQNRVWAIYEDSQGLLWVGTRGGGLNVFDRATGKFKAYRYDPEDPTSISDDNIWSMLEDHNGVLWITTERGGLNRYDRQTDSFITYKNNPNDPDSLSHNDVFWLCEDRSGVLWISSRRGGVNKLSPGLQRFRYYRHIPEDPGSLSINGVAAIFAEPSGDIWVGTEDGGLNYLDRDANVVTVYRKDPNDPASLLNDQMYSLYGDGKGFLWVGTQGGGLNRLEIASGKFSAYRLDTNNPKSIASDFITVILPADDGKLWLGTLGFGVDLFDPKSGEAVHFHNDPQDPNSLAEDTIYAIAKNSHGQLWIGTGRGGLDLFDPASGQYKHHIHDLANENSLVNNSVQALLLDEPRQTLWVGTAGGLSRLDLKTGSWRSYTVRDGLAGDTISNILQDNQGIIWTSTNKGISRLNPDSGNVRNFDTKDGLQSNQFNIGASFSSASGELFFGGPNGMNSFFPEQIVENSTLPSIVFADFQLFNQSVPVGTEQLPRPINETVRLELNYDQTVLSLEFAGLNYQNSHKNLYQYKMEGFDQDWSPPSSKRSVTYTNLDPGSYTFLVRASNNDGVWNLTPRSIQIIVRPPWWQTSLFQVLAIVLSVGAVIGFAQWRIRAVQLQNRVLEQRVQERTSELSETNQKLQQQVDLREQAEGMLRLANSQLQEQLREISALRDTLHEQVIRDPLTGLYNRRYLEEILEHEIARSGREKSPLSLIMIDIDYFKRLNDTYSHRAGDEILKALGNLMRARIRRGDIACRYGGEEFLIIMPEANEMDARRRGEDIRRAFEEMLVHYRGVDLSVTISLGIAVYPDHGSDAETLITRADLALYQAKHGGRNRVAVFAEQ